MKLNVFQQILKLLFNNYTLNISSYGITYYKQQIKISYNPMIENYEWQKPGHGQLEKHLPIIEKYIESEEYEQTQKYKQQQDLKIWLENQKQIKEEGYKNKQKQFFQEYLLPVGRMANSLFQKSQSKQAENQQQSTSSKPRRKSVQLDKAIQQLEWKCQQKDTIIKNIIDQNSNLKLLIKQLSSQNNNIKMYYDTIKLEFRRALQNSLISGKGTKQQQEEYQRILEASQMYRNLSDLAKNCKEWLPSDRNELTNRIRLEKVEQQYKKYQERNKKIIQQFEQIIHKRDQQIRALQRKIQVLQKNLQKMISQKNIERSLGKKRQIMIEEYKQQISDLTIHNERMCAILQSQYQLSNQPN